MSAWLARHKKSDLIDLASDAGLELDESRRKDDLVSQLSEHLIANSTKLAHKPKLASFYDRASPIKRERSPPKKDAAMVVVSASPAEKKTSDGSPIRRRRSIKEKQELLPPNPSPPQTSLIPQTPAIQRVAQRVALPASPALVVDAIERGTEVVSRRVSQIWNESGVPESTESARQTLSSTFVVATTALLLEAWGVQRLTLPWVYLADTPAFSILSFTIRSYALYIPDLFRLLTSSFWGPSLLWTSTSFFVPLVLAYFFNFTLHAKSSSGIRGSSLLHRFDPLTFHVSKALLTWLTYSKGVQYGLWSPETITNIDAALPGGHEGVLIGAAIGMLTTIYEAILRK